VRVDGKALGESPGDEDAVALEPEVPVQDDAWCSWMTKLGAFACSAAAARALGFACFLARDFGGIGSGVRPFRRFSRYESSSGVIDAPLPRAEPPQPTAPPNVTSGAARGVFSEARQ